MYDGSLLDESQVLQWMIEQRDDESIEDVDRETFLEYIDTKEFLAVVFYVEDDSDNPRVLRHIELIDDEAAEYGIKIIKCDDKLMAKKYGFRNPPGITYFRKGKHINYDGDIDDEEELLDWLTDPANMEMTDHIEKVNRKMFEKIRHTSDYVAVFFYSDDCKQCSRVLAEIEHIDDDADSANIDFVKIDDKKLAKEIGVFALPGIVFFKMGSKEPTIYAGDLYDEGEILNWLMVQKDPAGDMIEHMEGSDLQRLIDESNALAVYFFRTDGSCDQCTSILEELENIDDDCDRHGITFIKTQDLSVATQYGVSDFPCLVYFESQTPNVFEGDLSEEEEVLQWLITQKTEDRIELVTRVMLESMVEETQYLAVYFYKLNCNICDQILEGLEKVDDECDIYGIHMVKIQDPQLAKRYSIKTFPALVYFRNGNPLIFEGDLQNEESVLEWLIDDENRELADEIEEVNARMLERLLDESLLLAVFFYDENCPECDDILEELEHIDGDADQYGIDMVKISDVEAAGKYNIINLPSLIYFRKQVPLLYDGDLHDEEKILTWLTSQDVFEIKNEIEEVNRRMLDKLLEENEFVTVFFYESDHKESVKVLERLEKIDGETDNMDITFVKMADARYARKWGVTKLPAVVYFRNRFPSIYRGDFESEDEVLDWLRKNRYRSPELNLFMYALIAITSAFVLYTVFLLYGFQRPVQAPPPVHPKQQ
uniref:Thioredoxin domain-containing protein n=2 Tax=Cacopsylla melanoneura TaxID=428564 RepID=A0A8D8UME7_9HEMI